MPLVDSIWLTARDSATFSMLPADTVRERWRVEYTIQQANEAGVEVFNSLYDLRSQLHQHGAQVKLTPEERVTLIQTLTRLDAQVRHLLSTMNYFAASNELYLQRRPINLANLLQLRSNEAPRPNW